MNEVNQVLLRLYETTQSASVSEFPEKVFSLIKDLVKFDSGGFCDFNQHPQLGLKLVSAVAHNMSAEDKLRARSEYINSEKVVGKNTLFTDDPALAQAFRQKGTSVSLSVLNSNQVKPNVAAYGIKTESLQTLTMVHGSSIHTSFQTISLLRTKADFEYTRSDEAIANIILPHVFQAFSIHRQLYAKSDDNSADSATVICSLSGHINFIDDAAVNFLHSEFHEWFPPFLPLKLLEKLSTTSEKIYIGKHFTVVAQLKKDLLFLNFRQITSFEKLSPTEIVIAEMLAQNETYKAIAQRLGNQPATVRNQAHSIYMKFGISGKAELAKILKNFRY